VTWAAAQSNTTGQGNYSLVRWEIGPASDTTPPTGTISIDGGSGLTNSTVVTLSLTCNDGTGSGCDQMQFSNDGVTFSAPQAFAATASWTLAAGDGTKTVYAQFIDMAGNVSTAAISASITLDTTPPAAPAITSPADGSFSQSTALVISGTTEANAMVTIKDGATTLGVITADGVGNWSLSLTLAEGTHSFTAQATDEAGNAGSVSSAVNYIIDSTAPIFPTAPSNISAIEASSAAGAVVTYSSPTGTDSAGVPVVSCVPPSGSTFAIGTTTVTCTADDGHGNTASTSFTVEVVDTTAPVLTVPANISIEANAVLSTVALGTATATDIFGATVTNDAPAAGFPVGATTVTWTATDGNGLQTTGTQTVTVADTTAPVLTVPATVSADANGYPLSTVGIGSATATDLFAVTIASDAPAAGFPIGDTTVTWTATDANGNTSTATQLVSVNARLAAFSIEKAEVEWRELTDETGVKYGMTNIKTKGKLSLPAWMPLSAITRNANVNAGFAGQPDLLNQTVNFTVKEDKWKYKAKAVVGVNALVIKWQGAEFKYVDAASGVKLSTEFSDQATTSLAVDAKGHSVMLSIDGVQSSSITISPAGMVTSPTWKYDQDEDGEVTFELPFAVAATTAIQLTIDGAVLNLVAGNYFTPAQGTFELKAEVNAGNLTGAVRPATMELGLSLGDVAMDGQTTVSNWSKLSSKEWKLKHQD